MPETQQFCTFHLASMLFGVEVTKVQEVLKYQAITRVPLVPPAIRGLINLRGQIVTAIDLRQLLEINTPQATSEPTNIIVQAAPGAFSLLVDRIGDVLELERECSEAPPGTLDGMAAVLIDRAYKLEDSLMLSINVDEVVAADTLRGRAPQVPASSLPHSRGLPHQTMQQTPTRH